MLIPKDYIFANEIVARKKISNSNISMYIKYLDSIGSQDYMKSGNYIFLYSKSKHFPNYLRLENYKDLSGYIPKPELIKTTGIQESNLVKIFNIKKEKIFNKVFYKIDTKLKKYLENYILYSMTIKEAETLLRANIIREILPYNKTSCLAVY